MLWILRVLLTLTCLAAIGLGGYVLSRDPREKVNRLYGLSILASLGWMFTDLIHVWDPAVELHDPVFLSAVAGFSGTFIMPFLIHFTLYFPRRVDPVGWRLIGLLYAPAAVFALAWANDLLLEYRLKDGQVMGLATPLFWVYLIWVMLTLLAVPALLIRKYVRLAMAPEQRQILILMIGFTVSLWCVGLSALLLPLVGIPDLMHLAPAFLLIWLGISAMAVLRFRLVDGAFERVQTLSVIRKVSLIMALILTAGFCCLIFPPMLYMIQAGTPGFLWKMSLLIIGATAVQGVVMSAWLRWIIATPLTRLTHAAARLAAGELGERVLMDPASGDRHWYRGRQDEMDVLAETFNRMAATLERTITDLSRVNRLNAHILHSIPLGMAVVDLHGAVLEWNQTSAAWTGISRDAALGRDYFRELQPALWAEDGPGLLDTLTADKAPVWRRNVPSQFGETARILNLAAVPLQDADERVYGAVIVVEDVTERVRLEQQVARSAKLASVGQLSAGIAHEVNNPLGSISSLAQMLMAEAGTDEQKETLRTIVEQVGRISRILGDLVNFSRPRTPEKRTLAVASVIDAVVRLASYNRTFRHIEIVRRLDPSILEMTADGDQIQQLLLNLLLNAADAMPEGGTVTVTTAPQRTPRRRTGRTGPDVSEYLRITVSDTGRGIAADARERIFDPFFTTKPVGEGTGLGLSVCYGIVRAHGGRIEVESEPGRGTTVLIDLPIGAVEDVHSSKSENGFPLSRE
ncbi:MAG: PAS domain-containing protein [Chloroflexi bacterium]|nr:PAS domain-containing protein [Chloroflexota bacterium]